MSNEEQKLRTSYLGSDLVTHTPQLNSSIFNWKCKCNKWSQTYSKETTLEQILKDWTLHALDSLRPRGR